MGVLKNIEWVDNSKNTLVYKVDCKDNHINRGSVLTVRDSQVAIFANKGKMADVFLPGYYKLDTNSIPIITKLLSWKYGFETPFKSDVYFVSTRQFTNEKWGTTQAITFRDKDFGAIQVRGFGTYSFKVDDAFVFMQEISGTGSSFKTEDITSWIRSIIVRSMTDAMAESKVPFLDLAANINELGKIVEKEVVDDFKEIGLKLVKFNIENLSLPPALEEALQKSTSMNMMRGNVDVYTQMAAADAMKDAAKNPGMGGSMMGAGLGLGMGAHMGGMFGSAMQGAKEPPKETVKCAKCGAKMSADAKFCPECGAAAGLMCPKCKAVVKEGAKFCPECGAPLFTQCPKCKATLAPGAKFCPECGEKV